MSKKKLIEEQKVRDALAYLLLTLTNLYNDYGAGGAWCGEPIPLHEINKRLNLTEKILLIGIDQVIKEARDDQTNQSKEPG